MPTDYPEPPTSDLVELLHGVQVADPYRRLEDGEDPATVAWVEAEERLTEAHLAAIEGRDQIREQVARMWDYPKVGAPFERGGRWFQFRNDGLLAQPVLYVGGSPGSTDRVLIDPNAMSEDGTVALSAVSLSVDGSLLAYSTSGAGSDWQTWRVRDVATGEDRPDLVEWSKFSDAAWAADGRGFFYAAPEKPGAGEELTGALRSTRILFHRLGGPAGEDAVVYEPTGRPEWIPHASSSPDGRHVIITISEGTGAETAVLVGDALDPRGRPDPLAPLDPGPFSAGGELVAGDEVVGQSGDGSWLVHTDRGAERGKVVRARLGQDPEQWEVVVPETRDTLTEVRLYGGRLICHYLCEGWSLLLVHDQDGAVVGEIPLPQFSSVVEMAGRPESGSFHLQVVSTTRPGEVWRHDLATGETTVVSRVAAAFESDRYVTEQAFARSTDGTAVPMLLTRDVRATPDGRARVLLYGYGGFDVPVTPRFSVTFAAWLERGGTVAVANLRGGGEYGRVWYEDGRLDRKQNVFDDFCACARWLVSSGWSSPSRIAISGASNGGLLVGACLTQHPELFGAAVPEVGVLDMLRFHLWTIGWAWKSDYGDPDDPEAFRWLLAYSPLHNVRPGTCYPPTLVMTGDHDDRVVPAHSYKFAAALQAAQACDRPVLLRVARDGGHGSGKPTARLVEEAADRIAFLEHHLG